MDKKEWRSITKSKLGNLYKLHGMPEIAAMYGVTTGAIQYRLKFFGLVGTAKHKRGPKKSFLPNRKELQSLYSKMSMRDVAKHYGVGETVVFHRLRDYGISIRSRSESLLGKPKSLEHRLKMSESRLGKQTGANNPNWKNGVSSENHSARSRKSYHEWKFAVLKASDHKCASCGIEHGSMCSHCGHRVFLHAHHKKPFADNPSLRYDKKNGIALCERCHMAEHDKKIG